jgi:hypothetical protein
LRKFTPGNGGITFGIYDNTGFFVNSGDIVEILLCEIRIIGTGAGTPHKGQYEQKSG